jgi:hypothetical protein
LELHKSVYTLPRCGPCACTSAARSSMCRSRQRSPCSSPTPSPRSRCSWSAGHSCRGWRVQVDDPYTVVMRSKKLPMQLLVDPTKAVKMDLLSAESFSSVRAPWLCGCVSRCELTRTGLSSTRTLGALRARTLRWVRQRHTRAHPGPPPVSPPRTRPPPPPATPPQVFGAKKTRKKPKLSVPDLEGLATSAADRVGKYVQDDDGNVEREAELRDLVGDKVFDKVRCGGWGWGWEVVVGGGGREVTFALTADARMPALSGGRTPIDVSAPVYSRGL